MSGDTKETKADPGWFHGYAISKGLTPPLKIWGWTSVWVIADDDRPVVKARMLHRAHPYGPWLVYAGHPGAHKSYWELDDALEALKRLGCGKDAE